MLPDGGGSLKKRHKVSLDVKDFEKEEKPVSRTNLEDSTKCKDVANHISSVSYWILVQCVAVAVFLQFRSRALALKQVFPAPHWRSCEVSAAMQAVRAEQDARV